MDSNTDGRRSSVFGRARKSFFRSGGSRGCDVDTLRGTSGAHFEGVGRVERVAADSVTICSCFYPISRNKSSTDSLLLIKGPFCFVFATNDTTSPKYAIGFQYLRPALRDGSPGLVILETELGDPQYEIKFQDIENANKFKLAVIAQASRAESDTVRKNLGHENLLTKRRSVAYAEEIALKKFLDEQPSEPITTKEVLSAIPSSY